MIKIENIEKTDKIESENTEKIEKS